MANGASTQRASRHGLKTGRGAGVRFANSGLWRGLPLVLACALLLSGCASMRDAADEIVNGSQHVVWNDSARTWELARSHEKISNGKVAPDAWVFQKNGLVIDLKAGKLLNNYQGRPHTVLLEFFLLSEPNALKDYFRGPSGLRDLLIQDPTALGPSVLATQRLVVQPDSTVQVPLDRPELGKYLVIVAGFYKMDVDGGSRVIPVPGVYSGPEGIKRFYPANIMTTLNPFADQPPPVPGTVRLDMSLGEHAIDNVKITAQ